MPLPSSTAALPLSTPTLAGGEDLIGWSALPLLGKPAQGSWLFVVGDSIGYQSQGAIADARFTEIVAAFDQPWPFAQQSLAGIVIDGDTLARGKDERSIAGTVVQAFRASSNPQNVFIVCGERKVPRRLRELRDLLQRSAGAWRHAMAQCGRSPSIAGGAAFEGRRLVELVLGPSGASPGSTSHGTRLVLRDGAEDGADDDAIRSMLSAVGRDAGTALSVDRISVRKIGKTAVFLTGTNGRRYIMRIARSPIAAARARRNHAALTALHASGIPNGIAARVPSAVSHGTCGPYEYYVETRLDGDGGPAAAAHRHIGWAAEPVGYISALHAATVDRRGVNDDDLGRLVLEPIERLSRACGSASADRVLQRVSGRCADTLHGRVLSYVRTHGDFTESNCLFDTNGRLSGVVDWEVSEPCGLPFIDLLQLMPVDERQPSSRWQRFDAWMDLFHQPARVTSDPVMGAYVRSLGVEEEIIPALILAQWVTHAGDRAAARQKDARWMRLRVWQPLEILGRMLCD